jgi:ribonuclease-3
VDSDVQLHSKAQRIGLNPSTRSNQVSVENHRQERFSKIIQYRFRNTDLLERALTHRSFGQPHNEALEFLGDAVLSAVVSDYLFQTHPDATEGELTLQRSRIVNNKSAIYYVAEAITLGEFVIAGRSFPKSDQRAWRNLLANSTEALIGAIYLDGGIDEVSKFFRVHFVPLFGKFKSSLQKDSKSKLQEYLQHHLQPIPVYETTHIDGEEHNPHFTVFCHVSGLLSPVAGEGGTVKEAEQSAAEIAYELLCQQNS